MSIRVCCPKDSTDSGVLVGGVGCIVTISDSLYDGFEFVLPLDEQGDSVSTDYIDRTDNNLDGVAGVGAIPIRSEGVFCLEGQYLNGYTYIALTPDNLIDSQSFAVSMWVRPDTVYASRVFYTRGSFILGMDYFNQLDCIVHSGVNTSHATASTRLNQNTWYHIAASWEPTVGIKLYVNGVLTTTKSLTYPYLESVADDCYLARNVDDFGGRLKGKVQEVRLHASPRSAAWFLAEYKNFCDYFNFVSVT